MREDENGSTPVLIAIQEGHESAALWLMNHGADVCLADDEGSVPLHMAAAVFGPGTVENIITKMAKSGRKGRGADLKDAHGQQAIHYAACEGKIEVKEACCIPNLA